MDNKKILILFILILIISSATVFLVAVLTKTEINSGGFSAGLILNIINTFIGIAYIRKSMSVDRKKSLNTVLAGMGVRILSMSAGIFVCLVLLKLNIISFIVSVFIYYVIFLFFEIWYLNKLKNKN